MRIYIIRHGETDWNQQKRLQGKEDIPLNANGIEQANAVGRALAGLAFARMLTSPLSRARDTARIIAGYIGADEILCEEGLTECDFGSLSGMLIADSVGVEVDDVETDETVYGRVMETLDRYAAEAGGDILAVSHGGTIRALLRGITEGELSTESLKLKNACINIIKYENGRYTIERYNVTAEEFTAG